MQGRARAAGDAWIAHLQIAGSAAEEAVVGRSQPEWRGDFGAEQIVPALTAGDLGDATGHLHGIAAVQKAAAGRIHQGRCQDVVHARLHARGRIAQTERGRPGQTGGVREQLAQRDRTLVGRRVRQIALDAVIPTQHAAIHQPPRRSAWISIVGAARMVSAGPRRALLASYPCEHQGAVGAAKAERIGNRHINGHISRFVGAIIQIAAALDILLENIDGGR